MTPDPVARPKRRSARVRLDQLLVERGLVETRSRAQALVLAGKVRVGDGDGARLDHKPGDALDPATAIEVAQPEPYVSRGGHKLAAALDAFGIDPTGLTALDVGASTGGFTDVLLQRGARHVYALDVGRGQLAEPLRRDARVTSMERTNARTLTGATLPEPIDLAVVDVSFISLDKVLGAHRQHARAAGADRGPRQAAVRGGQGPDGPRRRARSRRSTARSSSGSSPWRRSIGSARARSSPHRSSGHRAIANSSCTWRPAPAAPRSAS